MCHSFSELGEDTLALLCSHTASSFESSLLIIRPWIVAEERQSTNSIKLELDTWLTETLANL